MPFWLLAAAAALLAALWLVRPLISARAPAPPRAEHDLQVFRDQLRSLDRDVERGVLTEGEAAGARAEISRRLLAADAEARAAASAAPAPRGHSRALALGLVLLSLGGGAGLYAVIGEPGRPDLPLAQRAEERRLVETPRPSQEEAERFAAARDQAEADGALPAPEPTAETAELRDLVARLRRIVAERPEDVRGRRLLAGSLLRLGEAREARQVQEEVIAILGEAATAEDLSQLGEAMILAAGGYVSPEAESRLARALQLDPSEPVARYYAGLALAQNGQPGMALNLWRALLAESPEDAPWVPALRAQIPELERAAGAPRPLPGPGRDDIAAAEEMDAAVRAEMIEGMVARLEGRLAEEGGGPDEWARLIRAYGVLGRPEDATRIWADARRAFADAPDALAFLRGAAEEAGADLSAHPNAAAPPALGPVRREDAE